MAERRGRSGVQESLAFPALSRSMLDVCFALSAKRERGASTPCPRRLSQSERNSPLPARPFEFHTATAGMGCGTQGTSQPAFALFNLELMEVTVRKLILASVLALAATAAVTSPTKAQFLFSPFGGFFGGFGGPPFPYRPYYNPYYNPYYGPYYGSYYQPYRPYFRYHHRYYHRYYYPHRYHHHRRHHRHYYR